MEVKRIKNELDSYDYEFTDKNKTLKIIFGRNLDLYFCYYCLDQDDCKFNITKENMQIYNLFHKLIEDVEKPNVFSYSDLEINFCETKEEKSSLIEYAKRCNEDLKRDSRYKRLYNNWLISWHSDDDDDDYDQANIVNISENNDEILLEFFKNEKSCCDDLSIRFRNSGSYYTPLNILFMNMYKDLNEYDPKYHQMHIEEVIFSKKMKHN